MYKLNTKKVVQNASVLILNFSVSIHDRYYYVSSTKFQNWFNGCAFIEIVWQSPRALITRRRLLSHSLLLLALLPFVTVFLYFLFGTTPIFSLAYHPSPLGLLQNSTTCVVCTFKFASFINHRT